MKEVKITISPNVLKLLRVADSSTVIEKLQRAEKNYDDWLNDCREVDQAKRLISLLGSALVHSILRETSPEVESIDITLQWEERRSEPIFGAT